MAETAGEFTPLSQTVPVHGSAGSWSRRLTDVLLPPRCLGCRARVAAPDALCGTCWREIRFITAPVCERLGIPLPYDAGGPTVSGAALANPPDYDRARAVAHYHGRMLTLVRQFKYADRTEIRALFGRLLLAAGRPLIEQADLLIPVPLARRRLIGRRYNQAAVVAGELGRLSGRPVDLAALTRVRRTRPQVGLSEAQRRENVRGAFRVTALHGKVVAGRRILLIDDVITTGATAGACARALKRAGAAAVDVLALAMVTEEARALV